jgi:class 3 adenylate cyclase
MNEEPIHRLYLHFQELPLSLRVLYTGTLFVLSVGYLFAIVHIYNSHAGRDGDAMRTLPALSITGLMVGVGIATGRAFVGNIRAADRMIWSAIGDTTNLSSRLQQMSRELEASIVIDSATAQSTDDLVLDWRVHPGTRIRGRHKAADLFSLPL